MSEITKPTYIGLTIGPIYKTLGSARKTIELWAASYIFSFLMKKIVAAVLAKGKTDSNYKATIFNPLADANRGTGTAGLYPDQLILESMGQDDFNLTKEIVATAVLELGNRIAQCFTKETGEIESIAKSIANALQTYLIELPKLGTIDESHYALKQHLASAELQTVFTANNAEAGDYMTRFLGGLFEKRQWLDKVFDLDEKVKIRSLAEIALISLSKDEKLWPKIKPYKNDDDWMLQAKQVYGDAMKKHHSYIAIVHADGDNVGETIAKLGSKEAYQQFCGSLMDFGESAIQKIADYGGLPIYAGGDDLLFFAPIEGLNDHIFGLLESLDKVFSEKLAAQVEQINDKLTEKIKLPTLSFGLSISYYKFPLYEALTTSRDLLFKEAKTWNNKAKHAIALNIQLHSGHSLSKVFSMKKVDKVFEDASYRHLRQLMGESLHQQNLRLNSVTFALDKNRALLATIGNDADRMTAFFKNTFNEDVHKMDYLEAFWKTVEALLVDTYTKGEDFVTKKRKNQKPGNAETVLRILHFLNQANDEQ